MGENPNADYVLIDFPSPDYDMACSLVDPVGRIFFRLNFSLARQGDLYSIHMLYEQLSGVPQLLHHAASEQAKKMLRAQLRKEFGADPLGFEAKNAPRSAPSADDVEEAMRSLAHV